MTALDAIIVLGFAAYAVVSGLRARKTASTGLEEYFLAGRSLTGLRAGMSMAATQFAADTPLLVTGLVATAGIFSLWRLWIYGISFLFVGFVLAASWRRAGVLTDAELAERRYAGRGASALRAVKALYFGLVFNCVVVAMVLYATKEIAEPFLVWHAWLPAWVHEPVQALVQLVGVPLVSTAGEGDVWLRSADNVISVMALLAVTALYSTTGGLRSVVQTDVAQLIVMLVGTALYSFYVLRAVGGIEGLHVKLAQQFSGGHPSGLTLDELVAFTPSRAHDAGMLVLCAFGLQWLVQMNADGTGYLAQRTMACRSAADARKAAIVFTVLQIFLRSLLWLPIALGLLVLFPPGSVGVSGAEREATYVLGIKTLLPAGVRGILLAAMLAALASTIDTHLNWGASYFTNDLYARFYCRAYRRREPAARELVWVARASNGILLFVALGIMTQLSSIQTAWSVSLLLGAGMGVLLVLRWLWWRVTALGELLAIVASALLAPVLVLWDPTESDALRLLVMALGSTAVGIAASLLDKSSSPEALRSFYRTAQPPGFWGPVAVAEGESPRLGAERLLLGVAVTGSAAVCVFTLLTLCGSWVARSPGPRWWPASTDTWLFFLFASTLVCGGVAFQLARWPRGAGAGRGLALSEEGATERRSEG